MDTMLTQTAVLGRPGWSKALLSALLGEPDLRKKMYGRSFACALYREDRVMSAERSEAFDTAQEKLAKRKAAAAKAVASKTVKLMTAVAAMRVEVTRLPVTIVRRRAVESYNNRCLSYSADVATLSSDAMFLERICVNYIRHELTEYDYALADVVGKTGIAKAVAAIRSKVYAAIAVAYPDFSAECNRQRLDRNVP